MDLFSDHCEASVAQTALAAKTRDDTRATDLEEDRGRGACSVAVVVAAALLVVVVVGRRLDVSDTAGMVLLLDVR